LAKPEIPKMTKNFSGKIINKTLSDLKWLHIPELKLTEHTVNDTVTNNLF